MADNNRNDRGSYRSSNQDWNENRGRNRRNEDEYRNYSSSENRGYGNSSNQGLEEGEASWQSRYEREDYNRMGDRYNSDRFGRQYDSDLNSGNNYNTERDYGSSSYYGSGNSGSGYSSSRGPSNRDRNLYDRDYEGMNRGSYSNSGTRLGAGNYGDYGNRGRSSGYSGSNYGSNYNTGSPGNRNEDRNWWNRASDEVSSWFGDEDAERRRDRDKQMEGMHRGKGPRNYSRSDDRIKEDVNDRLSDDPFIDATEIDVTVSSGEVTLTGTVDHRSTKRRAEDLAESVSGVKNVENRIRVGESAGMKSSSTSSGSSGTSRSTENQSGTESTSAIPGSERTRGKGQYVTG